MAATPATATPQSEEIPIRGFLTLKTFESRVIYCSSFSQELSLQPGEIYNVRSEDRRNSERSPLPERAISTLVSRSKFSPEDDKLLRQLKEDECLSWDEVAKAISGEEQGDVAGPLQYQVEATLRDVSKEK